MKGCKSQKAQRGTDAKSQSPKPHKPAKSQKLELGMQRMRKAKAKKPPKAAYTNKKPKSPEAEKPNSQEAKKPKSQEAKKPRSQEAKKPKSQEAKKPKAEKKREKKGKQNKYPPNFKWARTCCVLFL